MGARVALPGGLRYHALHHLVPHTPYHAIARLHRELLAILPSDHPYRETVAPGYLAAAGRLTR
jgi:fatty acid desaturase